MADPNVDLWAIDEVHFQQHGSRCQMWIPPETKDPILLHHPTRRSVGYFGAVRLRDGKFFFHRETDKFNGATFFVFLKALYRVSTVGPRRVVVITDNARYHHARLHRDWREQHADRFELDYLVDPEKVVFMRSGAEPGGLEGPLGSESGGRRGSGSSEKCAKKLRGASGSSWRQQPEPH
jgi:hypothetical protein